MPRNRLRQIADLARAVSSTLELETVLEQVANAVVALRADASCGIRLVDPAAGGYRLAASAGPAPRDLVPVHLFGQGPCHLVVDSRQPLLVEDARDPRVPAGTWAGSPDFGVYYGVPVLAGDTVLAVLNLWLPAGAAPTAEEREMLELLAGHAAVALRNARLFAASEARRRAAEAISEIGRVLTETLDLGVVSQRIAGGVRELLEARMSVVYRVRPDSGDLVILAVSGAVGDSFVPDLVIPRGVGVAGLAAEQRRPVVSDDVFQDERVTLPSPVRARAAAAGFRAVLGVPMVMHGAVIGVLGIGHVLGRTFDDEQIRTARVFADEAALAFQNARLFDAAERGRREAEVLSDLVRTINESLDLDTVLRRTVQGARNLCDADMAAIFLRAPGSDVAVPRCVIGARDPDRHHALRIEPGQGAGGEVLSTGRPLRAAIDLTGLGGDPSLAEPDEGIAATLVVPVRGRDRPEGLLSVHRRAPRAFSEGDETVLVRLADHAAVLLERVQLFAAERDARAAAEAANRTKDEFLATLSHELRTPLMAILGWATMLGSGKLDAASTARAATVIHRNARLQAQLVEDLLDVSRIITGKLRLDVGPVDLEPVVRAALEAVAPAAEAKGVELATVVEPSVLRISGDAGRLQQVVWNLLSNAVKFTPAGGKVTTVLARSEDHAVIRVSDTGKGIRAEFLPYVFERFHQADSATTRLHGGLGLGLAIVRHLVELHGGTVSVVSAGEGRGATFSVALPMRVELSLPRYESARAGTPPPEPAEVATTILAGVRVLVVDDQEDARDLIVAALEHHGARVVAAASAGEAMSALIREKPDVLVSDVAMPGEDGYSLMRQVRALAPDPVADVPALAVTAYARREDRTRALASGYRAHLSKPVEPARLARAVAGLAGRAPRPSSSRT